jgi:hypothetical protein
MVEMLACDLGMKWWRDPEKTNMGRHWGWWAE